LKKPAASLPNLSGTSSATKLLAAEQYERELAYALKSLHDIWTPHPAQVRIGQALLHEGFKSVFAQCGRNFGKTELVSYLLWRYALTYPGSENYYFAPFMKQAREILWASRRIQTFGPESLLSQSPNNTEMRLTFGNGSFIKLDGSDNVDAYRGVKPKGLTVFDEFKDFRPEFYEAYDPNRAAHDSPLLIIGTPPEFDNQFNTVAQSHRKAPTKAFYRFPTSANPHISKAWLKAKRDELIGNGESDVWEREYEARFVKGGKRSVFPMLPEPTDHERVIAAIQKDRKKLEWFVWCDPAAASVFGVLFAAINPYSKVIYLLDEIYEADASEMTVNRIGPRLINIRDNLFRDFEVEWRHGYDEAATWFASEMLDHFSIGFEPTQKAANDKEAGFSLIRDIIRDGRLIISSRCPKLLWEMEQARKDEKGKIIKVNDHLIDCLRYILGAAKYSLVNVPEINRTADPEQFRGARIEDDFPNMGSELYDYQLEGYYD
jgi:hypothetical protein